MRQKDKNLIRYVSRKGITDDRGQHLKVICKRQMIERMLNEGEAIRRESIGFISEDSKRSCAMYDLKRIE